MAYGGLTVLLTDVILNYGGHNARANDWRSDMQATNELTGYGLNGSSYYTTTKVSLRGLRALETVTVWLDKSHMRGAKIVTDAYETSTGEVVFIVREPMAWDLSLSAYGYTVAAIGRTTGTVVQLSVRGEFSTTQDARRYARAILRGEEPRPTLRGELLRAKVVEVRIGTYFDKVNGNPYTAWALIVDGVCRLRQGMTYGSADNELINLSRVAGICSHWRETKAVLAHRGVSVSVDRTEYTRRNDLHAYAKRFPTPQFL